MQLIQPLVSSSWGLIFFGSRPYCLVKKRTAQAGMASCRNISMVNTILKVRYLCFLLSTCLHLMKTAYILFCLHHWTSTSIAFRHTMSYIWPASLDKGSRDYCFHETKYCCSPRRIHTMMNFLGSICYLMERSGLKRWLIEAMYTKNTVPHTMSGKAVSRALRAHLLVESALTYVHKLEG